nr:unnamed protein product [Callosobruchus analis]
MSLLLLRLPRFVVRGLMSEVQSGFRPHFSTTTALLSITDHIYKIVDGGNFACLILLELQQSIPHN